MATLLMGWAELRPSSKSRNMQEIQRYQIYTAYIVLNTQFGSILGRYIELHVYCWQKCDEPG